MATHSFSFEGGEILSKMGATWFVSYAYYEKIDSLHKNWGVVSTASSRIFRYNQGRCYHKAWLEEVTKMNPKNLNTNTIGLAAVTVKEMAQELLENWK